MRVYNPGLLPLGLFIAATGDDTVVNNFVPTQKGEIIDRVVGASVAAAPVADRTLTLPQHALVIFHLNYTPGTLDTKPPVLNIFVGVFQVAKLGFTANGITSPLGLDMIAVDAVNPGPTPIIIKTDLSTVVNGSISWTAYSIKGGIS